MKDALPAVILADPKRLNLRAPWLGFSSGIAEKHFANLRQTFREIGEQIGGDFAFIPPRAQDMGEGDPALWLRAQW
jgi:hypothetical protein